MESSRSDHPSQTVNSSDRQPSQTVSCSDRQSSQTVSCSDRQLRVRGSVADEVQSSQTVSCSDRELRVRGSVADEVAGLAVAAVEGNAESLQAMEGCWEWSDVDQCWITDQPIFRRNRVPRIPDYPPALSLPNQRFATQRHQDFVDEDVGHEDGWQWLKDDGGGLQSEDSCRSVERPLPPTPRFRGPPAKPIDDPTGTVVPPPPCRPLPSVVPGPPGLDLTVRNSNATSSRNLRFPMNFVSP